MYIGRIVAAGMTRDGKAAVGYRVSSRSFPNRTASLSGEKVSIIPRKGHEGDLAKNPYIAYNCLRLSGKIALVTNGSQTDPIIEKVIAGMNLRDAFALPMLAMDYEKDSLDTPRIVAACHRTEAIGYLGIVRKDAVLVREVALEEGKIFHISTYEHNCPCPKQADAAFDAADAAAAAQYAVDGGIFADFTHPVTSAAALAAADGFEVATKVVEG